MFCYKQSSSLPSTLCANVDISHHTLAVLLRQDAFFLPHLEHTRWLVIVLRKLEQLCCPHMKIWLKLNSFSLFVSRSISALPKPSLSPTLTSESTLCFRWKCSSAMVKTLASFSLDESKWSRNRRKRNSHSRIPIVSYYSLVALLLKLIDPLSRNSLHCQWNQSCPVQSVTLPNSEHSVSTRWEWELSRQFHPVGIVHHSFA